jgi:hypothetical protein
VGTVVGAFLETEAFFLGGAFDFAPPLALMEGFLAVEPFFAGMRIAVVGS